MSFRWLALTDVYLFAIWNVYDIILIWNTSTIASLLLLFSGAFVPLTLEGNVVVDGVLASCYAYVHHDVAHVGMKPLLWFPSIMDLLLGEDKLESLEK